MLLAPPALQGVLTDTPSDHLMPSLVPCWRQMITINHHAHASLLCEVLGIIWRHGSLRHAPPSPPRPRHDRDAAGSNHRTGPTTPSTPPRRTSWVPFYAVPVHRDQRRWPSPQRHTRALPRDRGSLGTKEHAWCLCRRRLLAARCSEFRVIF